MLSCALLRRLAAATACIAADGTAGECGAAVVMRADIFSRFAVGCSSGTPSEAAGCSLAGRFGLSLLRAIICARHHNIYTAECNHSLCYADCKHQIPQWSHLRLPFALSQLSCAPTANTAKMATCRRPILQDAPNHSFTPSVALAGGITSCQPHAKLLLGVMELASRFK